jgi:hypothetical protein
MTLSLYGIMTKNKWSLRPNEYPGITKAQAGKRNRFEVPQAEELKGEWLAQTRLPMGFEKIESGREIRMVIF